MVDENYFKVDLGVGNVFYEGVVTEQKIADAISSRFPAAAAADNRHMELQVPAKPLWVGTLPVLSLWYTSPGSSTATFNVRFVIRVFGAGGTCSSALSVVDVTLPGPAVLNSVLFTRLRAAVAIPASPFGIVQLRVGRLGGDANANGLDILQASVQFQEMP
jgi:hypothetical protein